MTTGKLKSNPIFLFLPALFAAILYTIYVSSSNFQEPEQFSWLFLTKEILLFYAYVGCISVANNFFGQVYVITSRWLREIMILVTSLLISIVISLIIYYGLKSFFIMYYNQQDQITLYHLSLRALSTIVGFIIIYSVYISIRYYNEALRDQLEKERSERDNIELKYKLLYNKLDPHFLFNNFNTLHSLIVDKDSRAEDFIVSLSRIMRYSFNSQDRPIIPVGEELIILKDYISIMESRFPNSLHCVITKDDHLRGHLVPMSLLHLVENVIKHNEISAVSPIQIHVEINHTGVRVSNNVVKKANINTSSKTGLSHLNEAYKLKFGKEIRIERSKSTFCVTVPFI
jgi:sensor histidine kinase YesM